MRRLLPLGIALLAFPVAADAATVHVVRGHGWGHGIGMSQYGAYGFAQNGRSYDRILAHYYRGTRLTTASGRPVRVLLLASRSSVRFRGVTRIGRKRARPASTYTARRSGSRILVTRGSKRVGRFRAPLRVERPGRQMRLLGRAINGVRSGRYRGAMILRHGSSGGVTVVNSLSIDPYVQGVVPAEMPSSWHPEGLKAQAVAARSYALATRKRGGSFDQYPDTRSQVYRGLASEARSANAAVRATRRQVLTYGGRVAVTYFFSTSGGQTENVENVFLGSSPKPFLKSVDDPFDGISPRHSWRFRFSSSQMDRRLGAPGSFRRVVVTRRGVSPRIKRARIEGSSGSRELSGPSIRSRLGLYDTWASFTTVSSSSVARRRVSFSRTPVTSRRLRGAFSPAPAGRLLVVERRVRRRWVKVTRVRTSRSGRYDVRLTRRGTYRVRAGSVAGPRVRVRSGDGVKRKFTTSPSATR